MLLEHERDYVFGMDALIIMHTNAIVIVVWAWVLEHDRYYGLGMDAFIMECT